MFLTFQMNDREEKTVSDLADGADRTGQRSDADASFEMALNHHREIG